MLRWSGTQPPTWNASRPQFPSQLRIYETQRLDEAESYLVALAESTEVGRVASFDRSIDHSTTVERLRPKHHDREIIESHLSNEGRIDSESVRCPTKARISGNKNKIIICNQFSPGHMNGVVTSQRGELR